MNTTAKPDETPDTRPLLTPSQAARKLAVSTDAIRRMAYDGDLPAVVLSEHGLKARMVTFRFRPRDVEEFLKTAIRRPNGGFYKIHRRAEREPYERII